MNRNRAIIMLILGIVFIAAAGFIYVKFMSSDSGQQAGFDGQQAMNDVAYQLSLGPRIPGSDSHAKAVAWMTGELEKAGWQVEIQETEKMGHPVRNVVASYGSGKPWIVVGAHYDSRLVADHDTAAEKHQTPVPGANDGASGVAVLLELARKLPGRLAQQAGGKPVEGEKVTLLFIDAEDNGQIAGWDWLLGSSAFVENLKEKPDAAVIIDMIGDADLQIYQERNSDPALTQEIWAQAAALGYEQQFIAKPKFRMVDDHIPFINAGIPAVDIIDFDYPYWHTTADTKDKVSAESMKAVGDVLLAWLAKKQ